MTESLILIRTMLVALLVASTVMPVMAQDAPGGRVAGSSAGRAGEREARDQPSLGIAPTSRIESRLQTRIPNRLQTRIDRDYTAAQTDVTAAYLRTGIPARTIVTGSRTARRSSHR